MSKFKLEDLGDGSFTLTGRMSFDTAGEILRESESLFEHHTLLTVEMSKAIAYLGQATVILADYAGAGTPGAVPKPVESDEGAGGGGSGSASLAGGGETP